MLLARKELPNQHHGEGVEFAVAEEAFDDVFSFGICHFGELHAGVGHHGGTAFFEVGIGDVFFEFFITDVFEQWWEQIIGAFDFPAIFFYPYLVDEVFAWDL